jgi:hypothetical protein
MLFDFFSGQGVRSIGQKHNVEKTGVNRTLFDDVDTVNRYLEYTLHNRKMELSPADSSSLSVTYFDLDFGREWQSDGKVVRVTRTFAKYNKVYRAREFTTEVGKPVVIHDIYVEDVIEKKHRCILASEYLPTNNVTGTAMAIRKAEILAGTPWKIEVDNEGYARAVWNVFQGKALLVVKYKHGMAGQLQILEGFHRYQDRKLGDSIHGKSTSLLDGVRIHYNFVQRADDKLDGLTPMEHAGFPRLSETNNWLPLLTLAEEFFEKHPNLVFKPQPRPKQVSLEDLFS